MTYRTPMPWRLYLPLSVDCKCFFSVCGLIWITIKNWGWGENNSGMNILIPTTSFPDKTNHDIGGKFVLNEAMAYAVNGMQVKILTPHQPGALKKERIRERLNVIRFRYFFPEKYPVLLSTFRDPHAD